MAKNKPNDAQVDAGYRYERNVAKIFQAFGWDVQERGGIHDAGIDLICDKNETRLLIQCKNYGDFHVFDKDVIEQFVKDCDHLRAGRCRGTPPPSMTRPNGTDYHWRLIFLVSCTFNSRAEIFAKENNVLLWSRCGARSMSSCVMALNDNRPEWPKPCWPFPPFEPPPPTKISIAMNWVKKLFG